jgi:hypothetical protein
MNALTINNYNRWTVIGRFRIEDVVVSFAPTENSCSVTMQVHYAVLRNNLLQNGWVALEGSGRLEWMMLAETGHFATTAGNPPLPEDKLGATIPREQAPAPAPPRDAEAPKGIIVHFTSTPAGAEVNIDGEYWGSTPIAAVTRLAVGAHTIIVKKLGYEPWQRKITLAPGDDRTINADLELQPNDPSKPRIVGN